MLWTTLISICLVFGILVLLVWIMKLFGMIFVSRRKAAADSERQTRRAGPTARRGDRGHRHRTQNLQQRSARP
jgi:Na+-transporting methylmalonyl-CoA/oxaloacetate decarboxylase gamma subunit